MTESSSLKILIADDDEELLSMIRRALAAENYQILLARDGVEAVELAIKFHPDLVLMDVEMPRADGVEACRQLRQDPQTREVPIIMLTSRSTERDIVRGFEGGAHDYITKPFSISHLRARIKTWLLRARDGQLGSGSH